MRQVVRYGVLIVMTAALTPRTADAQVYPERIAVKARAAAVAYQRRARDDNREEQTERTTKTLKIGSDGSIDLENISGDITVTRGGGSDATVEIVKTARAHDASEAKTELGLVTVDVNERAGRVEIKTRYPSGEHRNLNVSVNYIVTAPAGARVSAQSISGNIKIADIKGDVSARTVSGDVRISGAARINTAKTISGNVEISDVKTDGGIDAGTVSGDIRFRHVSARRLGAGTVSGEVHIEDVETQNVLAQSTSGSIDFSGGLAEHGRYELKAFSGDVHMAISGNRGFEVEANSFSGDVRSDFPITTHGTADSGRRGPRRTILRGTYGDGSAVLSITTFNGSIVLTKR
jgi:DUF4097 and DUF4098 domain-containing protein YvlB